MRLAAVVAAVTGTYASAIGVTALTTIAADYIFSSRGGPGMSGLANMYVSLMIQCAGAVGGIAVGTAVGFEIRSHMSGSLPISKPRSFVEMSLAVLFGVAGAAAVKYALQWQSYGERIKHYSKLCLLAWAMSCVTAVGLDLLLV